LYRLFGITLSTDQRLMVMACPFIGPFVPVEAATDGLRIDGVAARAIPLPSGLSTNCWKARGLRLCPFRNPALSGLDVNVTGPHLRSPVLFEVGLAGNGSIARAILGSIRAAA
jgi:hypothetical protein